MGRELRFVFDTNVLVSVILSPSNTCQLALQKALETGKLIFSAQTSTEFLEVLLRSKFDRYLSFEKRKFFGERLLSISSEILIKSDVKLCRDPDDDKFLNLAVDGGASFIVTGDPDLLVLKHIDRTIIASPHVFLETSLVSR